MVSQDTLTGEREQFNPLAHGLYSKYVHRLSIDHGAWLRACAEGAMVGKCRHCGSPVRPLPPHDRGNGTFDYMYACTNAHRSIVQRGLRIVSGCGQEFLAPRGRVLYRSGLASERPAEEPA